MLSILKMELSNDGRGLREPGNVISNRASKVLTTLDRSETSDTPIVSPDRIKVESSQIMLDAKLEEKFTQQTNSTILVQAQNDVIKNVVEAEKVSRLDESKNAAIDAFIQKAHDDSVCNNEDDSSHDDSSYFNDPTNLPEPKSDGRFSWSSNASGPKHIADQLTRSKNKESDASLSLSDDSDAEEIIHHSHPTVEFCQPDPIYSSLPQFSKAFSEGTSTATYLAKVQPRRQQTAPFQLSTGAMELYPQQITRMHSVSSLVSTSSQASTTTEASIRDELRHVAAERFSNQKYVPSGRLSPVLGEHPPSRNYDASLASPSTTNFGPSPPQIRQSNVDLTWDSREYRHPQPHLVTSEQTMSWFATENNIAYRSPTSLTSGNADSGRGGNTFSFPSKNFEHAASGGMDNNASPREQGSLSRNIDDQNSKGRIFASRALKETNSSGRYDKNNTSLTSEPGFKVYWQRWVMLMYMSVLNLLSDWTCYSVAPIAVLTEEAFGDINSEQLVTLFLVANAVASACEPMLLARLGLRRTVSFGALLLMIGSIIKSGGMPPIIQADIVKGTGGWRVYLGFFIVGLSQPLYQCTPALLSASWFPEAERTMATGVALNANQIGIGFAFIFGTLLVGTSDDISGYFSLLSILSTMTFLGTLFQFSDAPPTPPSETAKVVRGTLEVKLPTVSSFLEAMRNIGGNQFEEDVDEESDVKDNANVAAAIPKDNVRKEPGRMKLKPENATVHGLHIAAAPSPAAGSPVLAKDYNEIPDVPFSVQPQTNHSAFHDQDEHHGAGDQERTGPLSGPQYGHPFYIPPHSYHYTYPNPHFMEGPAIQPNPYRQYQGYHYAYPYVDPNLHQYSSYYHPPPQYHPHHPYNPGTFQGSVLYPEHIPYSYQHAHHPVLPHMRYYEEPAAVLPPNGPDEGAEPVLTITPHHLDINIRDDQVILSLRACLARPGFIHSLVAFVASGIVINTLSTFMDYLVRLNGAGREYTGIVGGSFQFVIMISSLVVGQLCDKSRAYYSITIAMLVLGAFGLAECGVSLDADRGNELRLALVIVAALVGPLQPVSTELGVEVVYPLSENTVLVIQQLFSNLLSAAFIPCFKAMRDIGTQDGSTILKPQFTFSFYLLIVLHAIATVVFATFNGRYLRYEHEQDRVEEEERRKAAKSAKTMKKSHDDERSENAPLL